MLRPLVQAFPKRETRTVIEDRLEELYDFADALRHLAPELIAVVRAARALMGYRFAAMW